MRAAVLLLVLLAPTRAFTNQALRRPTWTSRVALRAEDSTDPVQIEDDDDEAKRAARTITGRYSKFAPDANEGDEAEFRSKMKQNWMTDREARRRKNGGLAGGQMVASYMDSL